MRNPIFLIPLLTLIVFISGCTQMVDHIDNGEMEYLIPDPPDVYEPEPVFLSGTLQDMCSGGDIILSADTDSARFENCTVFVKKSGINITRSEFINSKIFFEFVSDVVFSDNVVRDYPIYEEASVVISTSSNITFRHNHIDNNTVGVDMGESHNIKIEDNIFESNYQHNAIAMYKSSGDIFGNIFKYNYPHGIMVHFIPEYGETTVNIYDNMFVMNVEDAINFEDWTNATDESKIYNNIITKTNWAGINIEYNSWNANILIENNYINNSGYSIEEFPKNLITSNEWTSGWEHGIKLEDCSYITVRNNTVIENNENGIDVRNCRNVTIWRNTIIGNDIGLFIGGPDPYSFIRDVSPLSEENEGPSIVIYEDNYIFKNNEDVVEENSG